jgi:hypothetical protein
MTVKKLIEILQKFDPELPVGVLHDIGVISAEEIGVYEGTLLEGLGNKMIFKREKKKFVVIGNPGDFEEPAYHDNCNPIQVEEIYDS